MAQLTLRLIVDPTTKKKNVIISYTSDSDALPEEHEDAHRALVDKLIEGGTIKASELGKIIVEREGADQPNAPEEAATPESERRAHEQKS